MKIGDFQIIEEINTGGSDRKFYRCRDKNRTFILIQDKEIGRYVALQKHLYKNKIAVPELYWYDIDKNIAGVEDLGRDSLFNEQGKLQYYYQAIDELIKLQIDATENAPTDFYYDAEHIRWEQEYFKSFFLNQFLGLESKRIDSIQTELDDIAQNLLKMLKLMGGFLMHRDYQSMNLYIKKGRIRIIDFQSARIGPLGYDLASLLKDPYVRLSHNQEFEFFDYYFDRLKRRGIKYRRQDFLRHYQYTGFQRIMQALGAYANLWLNKGKEWFKQFIPTALQSLQESLKSTPYKNFLKLLEEIDI